MNVASQDNAAPGLFTSLLQSYTRRLILPVVGIVWVGITGVAPAIVAYVIIASASAVAVFLIVSVATCVRRIFHLAIFAIGRMCVEQHVEKGKFAYKAPK